MPTMLPIESKMELFARAYTRDTGIRIEMGPNFMTNGKVIYFPPIPDQADKWLRRKSEMAGYHEIGHCLKTNWAAIKAIKSTKDALLDELSNWVEDIYVEGVMETRWPGIKIKYAKYFPERVAEQGNDRLHDPMNPLHNNLMRILYYRCRERMLGVKFGVSVPKQMEALYTKLIAKFETECIKAKSTKETADIARRIYDVLKKFSQTQQPKPPQPKQQQKQKSKPQKDEKGESSESSDETEGDEDSDDEDSDDEDSEGDEDSDEKDSNGQDSDEEKRSKSEKEDSDEGGSEKDASDDGEKDDGDMDEGAGTGDEDNDSEGGAKDKGTDDSEDSAGGGADGCGDDEEPTPEDIEAAKKLAQEQKNGQAGVSGGDTDADSLKKEVNKWAAGHYLLTKTPGLKEHVFFPLESRYWQGEVEGHSQRGRELTGFLGTKLRTLLISDRAPRWQTNLETGRVDSRRLHRVVTGASKSIFKRRIPAVYEDAAVSMVVDYSSSMRGWKINQAMALLTSLSENLDRLRVPFETFGFLNGRDSTQTCMRTTPAEIAVLKSFGEPFRRVKHRFTEGLVSGGTNEFPAIELAAKNLSTRRETKKILFILTDGITAFGNNEIHQASRDAMKDFILRLMRAGMRVVGFGIGDDSASYYCPEFVMVDDKFATTCYAKLLKILI